MYWRIFNINFNGVKFGYLEEEDKKLIEGVAG